MSVTVFSPAKVNLFLAITSRRADGFHDLVSVAAPLDFGDELVAGISAANGRENGRFTLECNDPELAVDRSNLIIRAAEAFVAATGWAPEMKGIVHFKLIKRIPVGAGLGGGSSNAVATLRALNQLAGGIAGEDRLTHIAARLGSDCSLFLGQAPVVMRGRGENVELLPDQAARRIRGRSVLLFKPGFAVSTAWAYAAMARRAATTSLEGVYLAESVAERRLAAWLTGNDGAEKLLFNNMEPVVFEKYVALPALLGELRDEFAVAVQMSGSGSACFALVGDDSVTALVARIRESWGAGVFVQTARII